MTATAANPYSWKAWDAAIEARATRTKTTLHAAMDAAHDRDALGLDASARIGDILDELHRHLAEWLHDNWPREDVGRMDHWDDMATAILHEFGATNDR